MAIATATALAIAGAAAAGASVASSKIASGAAKTAAGQQAQSAQNALDFQGKVFDTQQANSKPYQEAGVSSLGMLMDALKSGKFGFGSNGAVPTFSAPTLEEARATPGYQFAHEQGTAGVLKGAAAAGGAISGGTLRALDTFGTGLADSTYGNRFAQSIQGYQANLNGYQTQLQRQAQEYQQLFAPAQLGQNAASGINNTGSGVAQNVGNLMTQQGNAQAAGTVGSSNAITGAISNGTNDILQSILLGSVNRPGSAPPGQPLPTNNNLAIRNPNLSFPGVG